MAVLSRTKVHIRDMMESDWSAKEIREMLLQELVCTKQDADDAYVNQLIFVEEVFEEGKVWLQA